MDFEWDAEKEYYFKNRFINFICNELSSVYCDTCRYCDDDCDYCHRKAMEWGISNVEAEVIANKAIEILENL